MNDPSRELGTLIQDYARAKWGPNSDADRAARLGAKIDPQLRDRIDVLGVDGERLLSATSADALAQLEALEHEAMLEDARGARAASRIVEGQGQFSQRYQTNRSGRDDRGRPGGYRHSAAPGRHGQRGKR